MTKWQTERAQLLRFAIVGGINTLFSYGLFSAGIRLGWAYPWATLAASVFGMVLGFRLHGRFVFKDPGLGRFKRFALVFVGTYGLSLGVQAEARQAWGGYWAGAIATAVTVPISFLLNRWWVFGGNPASRS